MKTHYEYSLCVCVHVGTCDCIITWHVITVSFWFVRICLYVVLFLSTHVNNIEIYFIRTYAQHPATTSRCGYVSMCLFDFPWVVCLRENARVRSRKSLIQTTAVQYDKIQCDGHVMLWLLCFMRNVLYLQCRSALG